MDAIAPQPLAGFGRQGGAACQLDIRLVIAREERQSDVLVAAQLRQTLDAIRPVALTAEGADDDQARTGDRGVQPIIDRQIVAEIHEVGEAEARRAGAEGGVGARQAGQLRIGGGSENDIARTLAEIDRLAISDTAWLRRQKVHFRSPTRR